MEKENTVKQAGGFIVQLMPFAEEEVICGLEEAVAEIKSVTSLLEQGYTPEMLLEKVLGKFDIQWEGSMPAQFYCNCSKEHIMGSLATISKKDIKEIIDDNEPIEVKCHFCNSAYQFTPEELKALL